MLGNLPFSLRSRTQTQRSFTATLAQNSNASDRSKTIARKCTHIDSFTHITATWRSSVIHFDDNATWPGIWNTRQVQRFSSHISLTSWWRFKRIRYWKNDESFSSLTSASSAEINQITPIQQQDSARNTPRTTTDAGNGTDSHKQTTLPRKPSADHNLKNET